ncbi:hypothetical protein BDF22DRAFT_652263 [Syncephalis plumigaleata]|nr:hypothetical protein BDF22DRAFT_652263 [Syncephalis plumigaleata]
MVSVASHVYNAVRDLSLDKLQAIAVARQEPALRRSVLIANLLRQPVVILSHTPMIHVDADGDIYLSDTSSTTTTTSNFFFDEHDPVVPLNYKETSSASPSTSNNNMELMDSRLAEEAWFDACFAELDDDDDDLVDVVPDDDDDDVALFDHESSLIPYNNDSLLVNDDDDDDDDDMVLDDVDTSSDSHNHHRNEFGSPTEMPELSPGLSDSGYCDTGSDTEAITPPSLGKLVDTTTIDEDEDLSSNWWPITSTIEKDCNASSSSSYRQQQRQQHSTGEIYLL